MALPELGVGAAPAKIPAYSPFRPDQKGAAEIPETTPCSSTADRGLSAL